MKQFIGRNISRNYFSLASALYLFAFLIIIWLLARYWLPPEFALVGHDSGLALDAKEFLQTRFYAWDQQGFGQDNSAHFGSLTLHSIDYISSIIAGVPYAGNYINIFFWLGTLFVTSFIFASSLKSRLGNAIPFIFPILITFNFFIFQSIFILERAKYSVFISILLFLTITIKFLDNKFSLLVAAILSSIVLFVFNSGSWLGSPLYASLGVGGGTLFLASLIEGIKLRNFSKSGRLLIFFFLTVIGFILLNSYSFWPYFISFTARDYLALVDWGVITANKAWLESMSQSASFLNIFRYQGIPDWYAGSFAPNMDHAYAKEYLTNSFLIISSFLLPVFTFSSLLLAKKREEKRMVALFSLMALISMFFMAGSHPPLGFIYEVMYDFIPGFSIFRSPYFKFGSAFILATSVLLAFSLSSLIILAARHFTISLYKTSVSILIVGFSLIIWFGYHHIILNPDKIFTWQPGLTTKVQPPQYIYDFKDWSIKENVDNKRILLLPPLNQNWQNDNYKWGYWSLSTIPSVLTPRSTVSNDGLLTNEEREWINMLYGKIRDGDEEEMLKFSKKLGVGYFLIRKDVVSDKSWSASDSPEIYEAILTNLPSVKKIKAFDEWVVYKIEESKTSPKISIAESLTVVPRDHSYLGREFLQNDYVYLSENKEEPVILTNFFSKKVDVYSCESCFLEKRDLITSLPGARILPNSPLYYFKILNEKKTIKGTSSDMVKADAYLGNTLVKVGEVKTILDTGLEERYALQALETANDYLKNYYDLFTSFLNPSTDFDKAKHVLDTINPIEKYLRNLVSSHEFGKQSEKFRQGTLDILWKIYTIKNYINPLYGNKDILEMEKIYYAKFPEPGSYKLFLNIKSLPLGTQGKGVLPSVAEYTKGEKTETIKLLKENDGWVEMQLPIQEAGQIKLKLKFKDLPNQFELLGSEVRQSPTGIRACSYGKINPFQKDKKYNISLKVSKKDQSLRMFFQESDLTRNPHGFIRGEDEVDIIPIVTDEPFRYIYQPSGYAKESIIYLCSGDKQLPVFDELTVHEIFSPLLVSTKDIKKPAYQPPKISFNQINPTKYTIRVEGAHNPFILYFNERFSSFWKLTTTSSNEDITSNHFPIDGYANAWSIDKQGDYEMILEYSLQRYFYIGCVITVISLIAFLIISLIMGIKRRQSV